MANPKFSRAASIRSFEVVANGKMGFRESGMILSSDPPLKPLFSRRLAGGMNSEGGHLLDVAPLIQALHAPPGSQRGITLLEHFHSDRVQVDLVGGKSSSARFLRAQEIERRSA